MERHMARHNHTRGDKHIVNINRYRMNGGGGKKSVNNLNYYILI